MTRARCLCCGRRTDKTIREGASGEELVERLCLNCGLETTSREGRMMWYCDDRKCLEVPEGCLLIAKSEEI